MISLELAQKLRDAGLKWEPALGQSYKDVVEGGIWLPRLDQLQAEIEQRGWDWSMSKGLHGYGCIVIKDYDLSFSDIADTPEEAVGLALLWILQEGE